MYPNALPIPTPEPTAGPKLATGSPADCGRPRRVGALVLGIVLLGLGDLYATLTHLTTFGMVELNPIANYFIGADSLAGLTFYKVGMTALGVWALLKLRRQAAGEITAWAMLLVMVALTLHWSRYNTEIASVFEASRHSVHLAEVYLGR